MANPVLAVGSTVGTTGTFTGTANTSSVVQLILPIGTGAANPAEVDVLYTGSNGVNILIGTLTPLNNRLTVLGAGTYVVVRNQGNCGVDVN